MSKPSASINFFAWKLKPRFSCGVLIAHIIVYSFILGVYLLFPQHIQVHSVFYAFYVVWGLQIPLIMLLMSWASPGHVRNVPDLDKKLKRMNTAHLKNIIEMGESFESYNIHDGIDQSSKLFGFLRLWTVEIYKNIGF